MAEQTVNFETLQLDDPRIPELCREKYRSLLGEWPAPGEMDDRAAVWAMAWLSKPDAQPVQVQVPALNFIQIGDTTTPANRLATVIANGLGSDHPAMKDLAELVFAAAPLPPAQPVEAQETQPEPRVEFYTDEPVQSHSMSIAEAAQVLSAFFTEFPGGIEEMQAAQPVVMGPLTDIQWLKKWTGKTGQRIKHGEDRAYLLGILRFAEKSLGIGGEGA